VRAHTGSEAQQANADLGSRGYASGENVALSDTSLHTTAHEAAHVVQQGSGVHVDGGVGSAAVQLDGDEDIVGDPTRWTDSQCMMKLQINYQANWNTMHETLGDSELRKKARKRFFDFRKFYVDGLIGKLRKKYPTLLAKSVGSTDLTSDYDRAISTPGSGGDVEAMNAFNDQVDKDFGHQPGTVFDTNLYAKDYIAVEENIDKGVQAKVKSGEQTSDTPIAQPEKLEKSGKVDQDVASLVKIRRYMGQIEYDVYVEQIVDGIEDSTEKAAVLEQYEEADAIYQRGVQQLLERLGDPHEDEDKLTLTADENRALGYLAGEAKALYKAQLLAQKKASYLGRHESDKVLEAQNELYYEKMQQVRVIQAKAETLEQEAEDLHGEAQQKARDKADVLRAQAKKLLGDAIFHASEAYHSEGAVNHVVAGLQGENAAAALAALKPEELRQSFNEQFGDFMKDAGHCADATDGRMFYRSSKYIYRMFDAVGLLGSRPETKAAITQFGEKFGWDPAKMGVKVKSTLLAIRKGTVSFGDEEKKDAAADKIGKDIYGVSGRDAFVAKVKSYSVQLDATIRSIVSSQVSGGETRDDFHGIEH